MPRGRAALLLRMQQGEIRTKLRMCANLVNLHSLLRSSKLISQCFYDYQYHVQLDDDNHCDSVTLSQPGATDDSLRSDIIGDLVGPDIIDDLVGPSIIGD